MSTLWILSIASLIWSIGCVFCVRRILSGRIGGQLSQDRLFAIAAFISLGLAPWISLITYIADDSRSLAGGIVNLVVAAGLFLASMRARKRERSAADGGHSLMPFRQKSAALMALTLTAVYAVYFALTWYNPGLTVSLFLGSAVLVIVVAAVGHAALASLHSPIDETDAPADERDREAERYGVRSAYLVLALGIWVVPTVCILGASLWTIANVAFAFAVLAEVVKYAAQVRYYRGGEA